MRSKWFGCLVGMTLLTTVGCVPQPRVDVDPGGPDTGPGRGGESYIVVAAGSSHGECLGPCVSTLTFSRGALHYELEGYEDDVYASNDGLLTELGAGQLEEIEDGLSAQPELQDVYGCPDCDDGGASWARLSDSEGASTTHTWESGNAPEAFLELSLMVSDLQLALRDCEASAYVTLHASCEAFVPGE